MNITYILQTESRWAKGETLLGAAKQLVKTGAYKTDKVVIHQVLNDANAYISDYGSICYGGSQAPDAKLIPWICAGTVGSILKNNK